MALKTLVCLTICIILSVLSFCGGNEFTKKQYLHTTNLRGIELNKSIIEAGLTDIENRTELKNILPPEKLYLSAKREIVISGISCYRTLDQHNEILENMLKKGVSVKLILLNPNSSDIDFISLREAKDVKSEILQTIKIIKEDSLLIGRTNFYVKFIDKVPSFLGVMIDGNIEMEGEVPQDVHGLIRVQPYLKNFKNNGGWIFQFNKDSLNKTAFDDFAMELRLRWKKDAFYYKEFFK
jgi:hypothetical protein